MNIFLIYHLTETSFRVVLLRFDGIFIKCYHFRHQDGGVRLISNRNTKYVYFNSIVWIEYNDEFNVKSDEELTIQESYVACQYCTPLAKIIHGN